MTKRFLPLCGLLVFICLSSPAQAQFTIEANVSGAWKEIANGDLDPDEEWVIFGPVDTGEVIERDFRFVNNSGEKVNVSGADFEDPFEVILSETTINGGTSETFTIRYTAGSVDKTTTIKIINDSPGATATYTFALLGLVPPPPVPSYTISGRPDGNAAPFEEISDGDDSPSPSDGTLFPTVSSSSPTYFTDFKISNTGDVPITFTGHSFSGPQAATFSTSGIPSLPFTLDAGAEETFSIRWWATQGGQHDATFELLSELSPTPFTFAVSGTAMGPEIQVRGENSSSIRENRSIRYGLVDLGTEDMRTFTIRNRGFDTLFITSITSDNASFQVDHSLVGIAPGGQGTFTIAFTPTALGYEEALITIESNALGDLETFNFMTEGVGESNVGSPEIVVSSTILGSEIAPLAIPVSAGQIFGTHFENVTTDDTSTREFTISNIGDSPLNISGITLDNPTEFTAADINTTVPAGGETTISVTFHPSSVAFHTTILSIANDDPDAGLDGAESPYQLYLSGRGVEQAPDIAVRVVGRGRIPPGAAPSVPLGTLLPTEPFEDPSGQGHFFQIDCLIENEGDASLFLYSVGREPPFEVDADTFSSIPSGESRSLVISGRAPGPGTYRSTIIVINGDGDEGLFTFDVQITLTGDGDSGARILSITENGADIDLGIELPAAGGYFIDESEDLASWSLMGTPAFSGQQGVQTKTLPGRATPPASGQRYFRLRLEE